MKLDKKDIILHVIGAFILTLLLYSLLGSFLAFIVNAIFWIAREIIQDYNKGYKWPIIWPLRRSSQKDAEALAPIFTGMIVFFL